MHRAPRSSAAGPPSRTGSGDAAPVGPRVPVPTGAAPTRTVRSSGPARESRSAAQPRRDWWEGGEKEEGVRTRPEGAHRQPAAQPVRTYLSAKSTAGKKLPATCHKEHLWPRGAAQLRTVRCPRRAALPAAALPARLRCPEPSSQPLLLPSPGEWRREGGPGSRALPAPAPRSPPGPSAAAGGHGPELSPAARPERSATSRFPPRVREGAHGFPALPRAGPRFGRAAGDTQPLCKQGVCARARPSSAHPGWWHAPSPALRSHLGKRATPRTSDRPAAPGASDRVKRRPGRARHAP